jgi:hypothetical protein
MLRSEVVSSWDKVTGVCLGCFWDQVVISAIIKDEDLGFASQSGELNLDPASVLHTCLERNEPNDQGGSIRYIDVTDVHISSIIMSLAAAFLDV